MEQQNKELAEDKVLILYLLNKIFDGIKNDNLYKIVSSSKDINYFYFQELIADLMSANLICSFEQDEESFIKITTEGKNALELTKSLLPGLLKLKADTILILLKNLLLLLNLSPKMRIIIQLRAK